MPLPVPPGSCWRRLHPATIREHLATLLCDDLGGLGCPGELVIGDGALDSFTVADRLNSHPLWLEEGERDGDRWLRDLVASRLRQHPHLGGETVLFAATSAHVHDQVRWLLEAPGPSGVPIAETLWHQEFPYVIDRVIALSVFGSSDRVPTPFPVSIQRGHEVAARLLDRFAHRDAPRDLDLLVRCCLTAGLLDLDITGGAALCAPISTSTPRRGKSWYRTPKALAHDLLSVAELPMTVAHLPSLLTIASRAGTRLVWFTDDLVETAVDLLVIQQLLVLNPTLRVVVAPRRRRTDNDATHDDINHLLRHRALRTLAATDRMGVTRHGPAHAAPLLTKLHPVLLRELEGADAVMVKGSRNHELLAGTLSRPLWSGYVVTREFSQSQAGFDGRTAPLLLVHSPVGERPWWGWRGRAHRRIPIAGGRTVRACWTTIADTQRRSHSTDPDELSRDLANLLDDLPAMHADYPTHAVPEIRRLADRLAQLCGDSDLVRRAHQSTGGTST
jgi:uncharacterized protein with ATP-grasp and redox domains